MNRNFPQTQYRDVVQGALALEPGEYTLYGGSPWNIQGKHSSIFRGLAVE